MNSKAWSRTGSKKKGEHGNEAAHGQNHLLQTFSDYIQNWNKKYTVTEGALVLWHKLPLSLT